MHRGLADALPKAQVNLGQMTPPELERAVTAPVEKVGLRFDTGLVDRLLDDVGEEPGNLPLMEFALKALWAARRGDRLLYEVYKEIGGVRGSIAQRAEAVFGGLDLEEQTVAEKAFTLLVRTGEEAGDTRRRAWLDELDDTGRTLVSTLAGRDARLLVTGRDPETNRETVEIAHEALLQEWPRLRKWIADRRGALRLREKVGDEARFWVAEGRPDSRRWKHELLERARPMLAGAGLLEAMERESDVADFLTPEAEWLLTELLCSRTGHLRREIIGMRLSEIGDPRRGVGVIGGIPDILWCRIPERNAGNQTRDRPEKSHKRFPWSRSSKIEAEDSSFRIAAFPVTFAQYRAFLDAEDGYRSADWWRGLQKGAEAGEQLRGFASYPADNVSWHDASAFCRWLSAKLGFTVRLPEEWEWQWAAQSARPSFAFPWGPEWRDGLANTAESGISRTSAVGMYPLGRSLQGVYDLAGNVWEWCRNEEDDYSRVLRGGSWAGSRDLASAESRGRDKPVDRQDYCGFRVACA